MDRERGKKTADIASAGHGGEIVTESEQAAAVERLQNAEGKGGGANAATGKGQADRLVDVAGFIMFGYWFARDFRWGMKTSVIPPFCQLLFFEGQNVVHQVPNH